MLSPTDNAGFLRRERTHSSTSPVQAALKIEGTVKGQEDMKRLVEDAKRRHKASPAYRANIGDVHKEEQLRQKAMEQISALNAEASRAEAG